MASCINLTIAEFDEVVSGKSTTSIRLGDKNHSLGPLIIMRDGQPTNLNVEITFTVKIRLGSIRKGDAKALGYDNLIQIHEALEHKYQKEISETEVVTILHFEMVPTEC